MPVLRFFWSVSDFHDFDLIHGLQEPRTGGMGSLNHYINSYIYKNNVNHTEETGLGV